MTDFTIMVLHGRLTDDPTISETSNGMPVCRFSVASNRRINKEEEVTSYIPVTVFGEQGVICSKYLTKGRSVLVEGRFETNKYEDKDGNRRTGFGVVANNVTFGSGGRKQDEDQEETQEEPVSPPVRTVKSSNRQQRDAERTWKTRARS